VSESTGEITLPSAWVVIPARGGSTGVPRKNVRLLDGKPLIAFAIQAALKVCEPGHVVVITDDDEIEEVSQSFGARVVREEKTTGKATLDDVMVRTIPFLQQFGAVDSDVLLTIQPTCPFISHRRIREALKRFAAGAGSVITVVDDRHLGWLIDEQGNPKPDYRARVNRQQLPPHFRESGAIIAARIGDILEFKTRIVAPISLLELTEKEAVDIDTFADWAVAEHFATRRKILLRTDAAKELGMGHVYRTLALAYALARHDLTIVLSKDKPLGIEFFDQYPFAYETVEDDLQFVGLVAAAQADLVVLDRLDNSAEFVELVKEKAKVITFEDLGSGAEQADLLISDLYENPRVPAERQLSGVENAILAPTFETIPRQIEFRDSVRDVLVLFGGTDPSHLIERTLRALESYSFGGLVTVVRGIGAELINPSDYQLKLRVLTDVKNMPAVMAQADIAISSAGRTITELSSIGVPTLCMAQNVKELTHTHTSPNNGVVMLGLGTLVTQDTLVAHVAKLVEDSDFRRTLHERAVQATAGRSNNSIVKRIMRSVGL
jgi:CMP-N-acetylneuraminic acid synthetase/spore coat polysaccharide biosynthesis predicted glycosyltransferase SpsG